MTATPSPVPQRVYGSLQASGFLLQTRIVHDLKTLQTWDIVTSEYPWVDPSDKDQFLDVLIKKEIGREIIFAGIECKKTDNEAYTFLIPRLSTSSDTGTIAIATEDTDDDSGRVVTHCGKQYIAPDSLDSEFCVVAKDAKNQRLLEGDARLVTQAMEAVARLEHGRLNANARTTARRGVFTVYISLIVTNALLFAAHYDPSTVSPTTGQIDPLPRVTPVPWTRFTKNLSGRNGPELAKRTVFVVAASELLTFLKQVEVFDPPSGTGPVLITPHAL